MGKIKAIQHRDREKIGFTEPYVAIQFTGSYNDIIDFITIAGIDNLDFPKDVKGEWKDTGKLSDKTLEKYCDRQSNFNLPGKLTKETYPPASIEVHPRDWIVLKYDLKNDFFVDVVDNRHLMANYEILKYDV